MTVSPMFVVDGNNQLVKLTPAPYESEDIFQQLLEQHPDLLAHAGGEPGKLMLIEREAAVPDGAEGRSRWSLDHLFIDQNAVLVLVEVKRSSDPRARREVVAQMLDYAANAVAYWPIQKIVDAFQETCRKASRDPDEAFAAFFGDREPGECWQQAAANLKAGRIRLVFVADRIASELQRIVEFLNEQMSQAEIIAIEVEQYVSSGGLKLLMPRLVGATQRALGVKFAGASRTVKTEDDWIADLDSPEKIRAAERAIMLLRQSGYIVGVMPSQLSLFASLTRPDGRAVRPFFLTRQGRLQFALGNLVHLPAFATPESRMTLLGRFRAIPGTSESAVDPNSWPSIPMASMAEAVWSELAVIIAEVRSAAL